MKLALVLYLGTMGAALAQGCPSPNPNLNAPPFTPNCPLPAAALNRLAPLSGAPFVGEVSITPTAPLSQGLVINITGSGTANPPLEYNTINVTDNASAGAGFKEALGMDHVYGGSALGGVQTLGVYSELTTPTSAANTNRNYVSGYFQVAAETPDNGTSLTPLGAFFGLGSVAIACGGTPVVGACRTNTAATNLMELTGGEVNIAGFTGSSMLYKGGFTIAALPTDRVQGSTFDCELCLSNQPGAVGWKVGLLFGNMNGQFPSSGTLIGTTGGTYANGVDLSADTISGCGIKTAHACIENSTGKSVIIPPTSCSGQPTGTLYNNSGTPAFCP